MTDLSKKVQKCGLCGCGSEKCYAISVKESQAAIDTVIKAAIEAIDIKFKLPMQAEITVDNARIHEMYKRMAIQAVKNVK